MKANPQWKEEDLHMVCDSVATISAQVDQKIIGELLASKEGQKALLHWLQSQFQRVEVPFQSPEFGLTVEITDGTGRYLVDLYKHQRGITVQGSRQNESQLGPIRDKVAAFVKDLGGVLLQQKMFKAIRRRYNVVESVTAPNKALVLKVKV